MRAIFAILFLLIIIQTKAQYQKIDTFYYDADWEKIDAINATYKTIHKYTDTISGAGVIFRFTLSDTLLKETNYANIPDRIQSGVEKEYFKSGKLKHSINYLDGKLNGELTTYYSSGQLKRHDIYKNDTLQSGNCYAGTGADTNYFPYMILPEYIGGVNKLYAYLAENIKYPRIANENGIEGVVYLKFVVNENGQVSNIQVIRGIHASCDQEAIRVISQMPNWTPGYIDGTPVSVWYKIPVKFSLGSTRMSREEKKEEKKRLKEQHKKQ